MKVKIKADIRQTDFILILIWDHNTVTICKNTCTYPFVETDMGLMAFHIKLSQVRTQRTAFTDLGRILEFPVEKKKVTKIIKPLLKSTF